MSRELVAIKGSRAGLRILLDPQAETAEVLRDLRRKLASANGFFAGAKVEVSTGGRRLSPEEMAELVRILEEEFGLILAFLDQTTGNEPPFLWRSEPPVSATEERTTTELAVTHEAEEPTLLLRRTLRSGQSVRFKGNVVILGDVNPGAEVVATGDIIVMGHLRGVVHAGAAGNREAIVAAFRLSPTQLRIADVITRAPDNAVPPAVPEVARIRENGVVIEEYVC